MFCPKCGAENPDGAKYCSKCGADLGVSTTKPETETTVGLAPNVAGLLCYVLGWITGIIFVVLEKKSTFVKFHAWQSIITFAVLSVAYLVLFWIPFVGFVLATLIGILSFVLWIILIIQAGSGKMWKLPVAGDWAEKQAQR